MLRIAMLCFVLLPVILFAQPLPSIDDKTKGLKKYEGLLNYYWEEDSGKVWLEVGKPGVEILYNLSLPAAIGSNDIGLDRGLLGEGRIITFNRVGRKLLMVQPNYNFRARSSDKADDIDTV